MDEMLELWEELKFEVGSIGNDLIPKDKREILIGMGDRKAPILFIGNDANLYLSENYKVAHNSSGEFLLKLLDIVEIHPNMYYITTLSKRGANLKFFTEYERKKLLDLLFMQIALIEPKIIVLLGNEVAKNILERDIDIEKERGTFIRWRGNIQILISYDIEYVMKARIDNGKKSTIANNFWNDIKLIKNKLDSESE